MKKRNPLILASAIPTKQVNWALSRGRFVVHPGWYDRTHHFDAQLFLITFSIAALSLLRTKLHLQGGSISFAVPKS